MPGAAMPKSARVKPITAQSALPKSEPARSQPNRPAPEPRSRRGGALKSLLLLVLVVIAGVGAITLMRNNPDQAATSAPAEATETTGAALAADEDLSPTERPALADEAATRAPEPAARTAVDQAEAASTTAQTAAPPEIAATGPAPALTVLDAAEYVLTGPANGRECPSTTCAIRAGYSAGEVILVDAITEGDNIHGSHQWMRTTHNGEVVYVHSSRVTRTGNQNAQP
jgi:cytoskeletal protein RodZ